ncbi:MAG: cytochrome c [Armatimonadetes bacterium]|nr:cytochrome c [Armatimonadota bacterium]
MRAVLVLAVAASAALLPACRAGGDRPGVVVMPGMYHSVPYDAYDRNPVTAQGLTLLLPPEGTVPLAGEAFPYGPGPAEAERAARELVNPFEAVPPALARGKQVFENVCAVCHGSGGQGDGPIIGRFPNPPSLTAARARALPDGHIVHVIARGQGIMPAHAPQVLADDRWRVVLHLRQLQAGGAR